MYGSNCDMLCFVNCVYSMCYIDFGMCYDCKFGWIGIFCKKGMIVNEVFD